MVAKLLSCARWAGGTLTLWVFVILTVVFVTNTHAQNASGVSAQIVIALNRFATQTHTWTGTQTFSGVAISAGGSTVVSTGVGSVKMSTANPGTNASWIPITYSGVVYYVPGWTTNAP